MKLLLTLCLSFFVCFAHAQTTIYSQTFESTYPEWSLNTTDVGGDASLSDNQWVVNNVYTGGTLAAATANEPVGIVGEPNSYYLHIFSLLGVSFGQPENDNFDATGANSYFAAMNTPIVTTGYTNVNLAFWWICKGNASAVGQVYYRTSSSGPWIQIGSTGTTPVALDSYNTHNTWQQVTGIHMAAFDGQAFLEFGFRFKHGATGQDPAFGLDDISVTGTASAATPVTSFTTTATTTCQDSCLSFTSTTTGTVDSMRWTAAGATITSPTSPATSICFPAPGTYSVSLTAYNSAGSNTATTAITVNPTPTPVVTQVGNVLSVTGAYTSYQWYSGTTLLSGATNSSYTITASGAYKVEVDSLGCLGFSSLIDATFSTHVAAISNSTGNYWIAQPGSGSININASKPLDDALMITIFDATGRKIVDATWNAGSYSKQINDLTVASGLYLIKLSNSYTSTVLKWLKK